MVAALGLRHGVAALGFAASAWLIPGAFAELVERSRLFRIPFAKARARLARHAARGLGRRRVAHAGMGVTVAGIAGMSLAPARSSRCIPGETTHFAGYDWTLTGLHDEPGPNYNARVADLAGARDGRTVALLHPSRADFTDAEMTTTDTAIETNGLRDLYAVLGEERDGAAVLRLHVQFRWRPGSGSARW